ncbi:MAG: hypothetical protein HZB26_06555 [Candidatus Hydrogenedentes bacterium]|nr:hypothetical protein [Candidatus Hydrogenedentota bacterium]
MTTPRPPEIPYSVTPRPDTGFTNAQLGMGLFLVADLMLFGGLLSSYVLLRVNAGVWPPDQHHPVAALGALKTGLLFLIVAATNAARHGKSSPPRPLFFWLTALAALAFLATTGAEYAKALSQGMAPGVNTYIGMFYALTAVHALHVLAGLVATLSIPILAVPLGKTDPLRLASRRSVTAMYWYFLTAVWFVIFAVLYLA